MFCDIFNLAKLIALNCTRNERMTVSSIYLCKQTFHTLGRCEPFPKFHVMRFSYLRPTSWSIIVDPTFLRLGRAVQNFYVFLRTLPSYKMNASIKSTDFITQSNASSHDQSDQIRTNFFCSLLFFRIFDQLTRCIHWSHRFSLITLIIIKHLKEMTFGWKYGLSSTFTQHEYELKNSRSQLNWNSLVIFS